MSKRKYTVRDRERKRREKANATRIGCERFVSIPYNFLVSETATNLSPQAWKLLFNLLTQLTGDNNGDLQTSWTLLKDKGWNSRTTLSNAIKELRRAGVIMQTRAGGRNLCSLYALTFVAIDECLGENGISKHNARPTKRPLGLWHPERKEYRDIVDDDGADDDGADDDGVDDNGVDDNGVDDNGVDDNGGFFPDREAANDSIITSDSINNPESAQ